MPPPPMPCSTRATISIGMSMATPQSREAAVNSRIEISSRRLRPMRRAIQPDALRSQFGSIFIARHQYLDAEAQYFPLVVMLVQVSHGVFPFELRALIQLLEAAGVGILCTFDFLRCGK